MHNCLSFIDNNHMLHNLADVFRPVGTFSVTAVCLRKTSHKTYAETHVSVDPHCRPIAYWLSCFAELDLCVSCYAHAGGTGFSDWLHVHESKTLTSGYNFGMIIYLIESYYYYRHI